MCVCFLFFLVLFLFGARHPPDVPAGGQALIHGLQRHYYSIVIDYRKNELEEQVGGWVGWWCLIVFRLVGDDGSWHRGRSFFVSGLSLC